MKTLAFPASFILLFVSTSFALAQEFQVPENYKFETKEDYARYVPDVLRCIDYLEATPLDAEGREDANAFLFKWITGSPTVTIQILPYVVNLVQDNKPLLMIFLGGWTKHAILHPEETDSLAGQMAGLESLLMVYSKGTGVEQDDTLDDLLEKEKEGSLREWLEEAVLTK